MCADKARAVSYRHTVNLGQLKYSLPAGRRWVETSREVPDTLPSSFRWRWPGGKRGPTRASAPTGRYEGRTCVVARSPSFHHPCRGGCPHPPVSSPPSTTKQSASEFRRTDLSTPTPKFPPDRHTRGQSGANAQVRREPVEDFPVLVGNDSEDPRIKQTFALGAGSALSVLFFWTVHCAAVGGFAAYGCGVPLAGAARLSPA